MTIDVSDVNDLYHGLKDKAGLFSSPKSVEFPGRGSFNFVYFRDPEGNLIELVSGAKLPVNNRFGGVRWVGISVTDLDRSVSFYQKYTGLDTLFVEPHENYSGLVDEAMDDVQWRTDPFTPEEKIKLRKFLENKFARQKKKPLIYNGFSLWALIWWEKVNI
jgi:catechol 2,3-dioxygenase-like lactoylglutathione lyase family enzyme